MSNDVSINDATIHKKWNVRTEVAANQFLPDKASVRIVLTGDGEDT
jgi:hypothetical protein